MTRKQRSFVVKVMPQLDRNSRRDALPAYILRVFTIILCQCHSCFIMMSIFAIPS
jgi:hypothetical protein